MNKRFLLAIIALLLAVHAFPQMYILNEDFSGASGTTPPPGWNNIIISGGTNDKWHFDNPGDRILSYPITEPFAIFDSDSISGGGGPEVVALETPLFDASTSNYVLLQFIHVLDPGSGGSVKIEAYDGDVWHQVFAFSAETPIPTTEIVDISQYTGGITNGRLRFIWSGNSSGFWAIDNIRIYASLPLDGGVVSIDNPYSPVDPGVQNVEITLGNFGYNALTSTTINWTVDGVAQTPYTWNGSIGFGQTQSNIVIGTYNFQDPVEVKVWQLNPNNQTDLNPYNDTVSEYLVAALCGTYTVGGTNPDFESFSQVAEVLNVAGVNCPVEFIVRSGVYYEEFELWDIPGVSETNTITFRSESGDSTQSLIKIIPGALKYEAMISMNGSAQIIFDRIGFATGSAVSYANKGILLNNCNNIQFNHCYFEIRNQFDLSMVIKGGSRQINVGNSYFECYNGRSAAIYISDASTRDINIYGNYIKGAIDYGYPTIWIANFSSAVEIAGNDLERCFRAIDLRKADSCRITGNLINNCNEGVHVDSICSNIEISGNWLTNIKSHQDVQDGTNGIMIKESSGISVYNNFIHTVGTGAVMGIMLEDATSCKINFNSINVANTDKKDKSVGIYINEDNQVIARNNIFRVKNGGTPVYITGSLSQLDFDKNNYYSYNQSIGYYNGTFYGDLAGWRNAVNMDDNSLSCNPFYSSDTDLSINQALLNNVGTVVSGITIDIDGNPRNPATPDLGAREYSKCTIDAGINEIISPNNPMAGGPENIVVQLQNQGTVALTSATINWSVNGVAQSPFSWSGSLVENANSPVTIGSYNFQAGIIYTIKAWTSAPNSTSDCNNHNDTITSRELAVPLCGDYTIGGNNPDFETIDEAVTLINLAGVNCPVNFLIRDGVYYEQLVIKAIQGSSSTNIVTFRSESGDSSKVTLHILLSALKFESMLFLEGTSNVIFKDLGLFTGSSLNYFNNAVTLTEASNIRFENCNFEIKKESDIGVSVLTGCSEITITGNRMACLNAKAMAIQASGNLTRDISIIANNIKGATEWLTPTIKIGNYVKAINISDNLIENSFRPIYFINSDSALVNGNTIKNCNEGVYIDNGCTNIEISANRFTYITSHQNAADGTSAITSFNASKISIINNFIHTSGQGPVLGINFQSSSMGKIAFNSVNLANSDIQNKSKGIYLKSSSNIFVKNNILKNKNSGIPIYINSTLVQFDIDYNDYLGYNNAIGYCNGTTYEDMAAWRSATGMDLHSFTVSPFFTSDTDLSINQSLLNNSGIPVAGITTDIDGTIRNAGTPDIGAKEYDPCPADAGINAFTSPVPPLSGGMVDVKVILQNQGTDPLTSVKINWLVNDNLQSQYSWSGNLAEKANTEVLIGSYDFSGGNAYILEAYTSSPNNTNDCNLKNDTILSHQLSGPLCGTYTIGGANADFATVGQAAEVLNSSGITCPVEFVINDGLYYEKFILKEITGASEENTITFRSNSGDSSLAVLKIDPEAVNYEPLIFLNKTQYITFDHLGLFTGAEASIANYAVQLDGAKDVHFEGCYFEVRNESDFGLLIQGGSQDVLVEKSRFECTNSKASAINITGLQTRDIDILDNSISGSVAWGNTLVKTGNNASNINISRNSIQKSFRALYCIGTDSLTINNNAVRNSNYGIYIDNLCSFVKVENNRLINIQSIQTQPDGTSGIFALNVSDLDIINNFVQAAGTGPGLGINLQNASSCRTLYNSVNMLNTDAQGKSRAFYLKTADSLLLRNNIFCTASTGIPIHIDIGVTNLNVDYNDYYNPSGTVGKLNNIVYDDLFEWGQNVKGDANSMAVNPYFKADSIPLPYQKILNGSGIPIAGVIYDIDGKLRHIQAPDMGCIEFFVDYGVLDLLSPDLNCYQPDIDSVIVFIRQYGDVPFDNLKVAYQINNGTIHIDTIPGPLIFDITHTFGNTESIAAPGEYLFKIWLIGTLDDNINNDTLKAWRYSKPPPIVSIEYDNVCTGWEVHFTGNATIEEPYYVAGYEWLFGDGDTSYLQNPVHAYDTSGTYEVILRAYSNIGCYSEEYVPLTIYPDFQGLQMDYTLVNQTCQDGGTGSLEVFPSGGNPPYKIYLNDVEMTSNPMYNFMPGKYEVRIVDSQECSRTDSIESFVLVKMNPQIIADPLTGYTPLTVNFDFTVDSAYSWVWHFTETDSDTNKITSYTFTDYGHHEVILGVNSGPPYYCTETTTVDIFVDIIVNIEANSVFTPNGDDHNDYFEVKSSGLRDIEVSIFNQWGNKVYEFTELDGKWDGNTSSGAKAPDGTYFYSITATGINDKTYTKKGSVLLLRHGAAAYPNPVTDHVRVESYEVLESPVTISVYSVFGQLSHSEVVNDPLTMDLDLSHLPGGIYIIKASDGSRDCFVRIIKK